MFIYDYFFGSIFFVLILLIVFCLNTIQLFKIKNSDANNLIIFFNYIGFNGVGTFCPYMLKSRVFSILFDWVVFVNGTFVVFCMFLLILLFSSVFYGGFDGNYLLGNFLLSFYWGIFLKIFCLVLFVFFFLSLKYISFYYSYITFEFFFFFFV